MIKINMPISFLNVEDLAARWQCSIHKIEALAEENKLQLFVRPIALEIALDKLSVNLPAGILKELTKRPLDSKNIYYLFTCTRVCQCMKWSVPMAVELQTVASDLM